MKKLLLLGLLTLCVLVSYSQTVTPIIQDDDNQIVKHKGYTLSYNETCEQPNWVHYRVTKADLKKDKVKRTDNFKQDKKVKTKSASLADYKGSGYDRGHLASAADFAYNDTLMRESFLMSNMSPQDPSFNRGVWKRLENAVRASAMKNDTIYVITGGVLYDGLKTIGDNKVCVPKFYFKVMYTTDLKFTCFMMRNEGSREPLSSFLVDKKQLEDVIAISFVVE